MSATVRATRPVGRAPARERSSTPSPAVARRRRVVVGILAVTFVAFVALVPVRTLIHQRQRLAVAEQRLRVLEQQTSELEAKRRALRSDAEIERIARERLGMVRPGETPYSVLTDGTAPTPAPAP